MKSTTSNKYLIVWYTFSYLVINKDENVHILDTPKRMIERRERERQNERCREGGRDKRERQRERCKGYRERVKGRGIEHSRTGCALSQKIQGKSSKRRNKAQRKVDYKNYVAITMSRNYYRKLSQEIISQYIMSRKIWELQGYCRIQKLLTIIIVDYDKGRYRYTMAQISVTYNRLTNRGAIF